MDSKKECVFSGATENLNTSMRIKLDDGSLVEVWISDEFAESATPKLVKEVYVQKNPPPDTADMKQLRELAAKLGITIPGVNQPLPAAEATPIAIIKTEQPVVKKTIVAPTPTPSQSHPTLVPMDPKNRIISSRAADSKDIMDSVHITRAEGQGMLGEAGSHRQYAIQSSDKPSVDFREGEVAEIGMVRGRGGVEIAIPVRKVGKAGTTNIRVVNTGNDQDLQRRFKAMAEDSKTGKVKHYGKEGYDGRTVKCPLCATKPNPKCKKCNGLGSFEIGKY